MIDKRIVGDSIRQFRQRKQLSQEVTSGLMGISRSCYSAMECGVFTPILHTIFRVADALNVKPHEIVKVIEERVYKERGNSWTNI